MHLCLTKVRGSVFAKASIYVQRGYGIAPPYRTPSFVAYASVLVKGNYPSTGQGSTWSRYGTWQSRNSRVRIREVFSSPSTVGICDGPVASFAYVSTTNPSYFDLGQLCDFKLVPYYPKEGEQLIGDTYELWGLGSVNIYPFELTWLSTA